MEAPCSGTALSWPDARIVWIFLREDRGVYFNARLQAFSNLSGVGVDPLSTVEHLHRGSGEPYIHFLLDVFKGNGIVHTLHTDVVAGATVATYQDANSNGLDGNGHRNGRSSAKLLVRLPSRFWKGLWLKASKRSPIGSFGSNALEFFVDIGVVRHLVDRFGGAGRE